ncbi:MAG: hypothetical protein M1504_01340 [Candidatus Marsarchaeota archaeon]|nr:hypothetical protein [Candidatus Marsarchaeota archaeon]
MDLLEPLASLMSKDVAIAGGKGASLGEMINAGIPVPGGFVILSSTFDIFIESNRLNEKIDKIMSRINSKDTKNIEKASLEIRRLILKASIPKGITKSINNTFMDLGSDFVAVRSSATSEDASATSWAGQLDTYLNTTSANLLENVKRCWASLFTTRAIAYRFENKLQKKHISVAVVIQKMVESEKSGIAFSVHPVTQNRNQLIIEAAYGLGEAVVSGQITPDSYIMSKEPIKIIEKSIAQQEKAIMKQKNGKTGWIKLGNSGKNQKLSDKEILELSKLVIMIEQHYGFPCDIEWASEKGKLYIVQSRPITTLTRKGISSK